MNNVGFIILRHVNSIQTNKYWQECYRCIRNIYPNIKIVIIDDDSNPDFLTDIPLINTIVVESEFKKRGELLPYYYYIQNKWFDNAVILHDSVFIQTDVISKYIEMNMQYKMLWHFSEHYWDLDENIVPLIFSLNNSNKLLDFYNSKRWNGCFGGMSLINYDFLTNVNNKYDFSNLLSQITTRENRCSFERVIACMFQFENKEMHFGILGDIHTYCNWGYSFDEYMKTKTNSENDINKYPVIKVWSGR
jgi:hypothetical protein